MLSESVIIRKVNYRRNNVKKNNRKYFSDISILTLLVLVMSALYILYFVAEMKNSSELFLLAYTSVHDGAYSRGSDGFSRFCCD